MSKADTKNNNFQYICSTLAEKPLTQIISSFQSKSISERYRRYRNHPKYSFEQQNPYFFAQRLKLHYFTKEDVDLKVIRPIKFEVCLIVKIYFLRLNNSHLPKKFESFLEELKARTQESRNRTPRKKVRPSIQAIYLMHQ